MVHQVGDEPFAVHARQLGRQGLAREPDAVHELHGHGPLGDQLGHKFGHDNVHVLALHRFSSPDLVRRLQGEVQLIHGHLAHGVEDRHHVRQALGIGPAGDAREDAAGPEVLAEALGGAAVLHLHNDLPVHTRPRWAPTCAMDLGNRRHTKWIRLGVHENAVCLRGAELLADGGQHLGEGRGLDAVLQLLELREVGRRQGGVYRELLAQLRPETPELRDLLVEEAREHAMHSVPGGGPPLLVQTHSARLHLGALVHDEHHEACPERPRAPIQHRPPRQTHRREERGVKSDREVGAAEQREADHRQHHLCVEPNLSHGILNVGHLSGVLIPPQRVQLLLDLCEVLAHDR
mmetsp:Transcript_30404/g.100987  ORF Transcript_30404/g.100987 Transcript_30404/m.100987 type:complete len:348 (-) Transcript_30404:924-1967(-)